MNIKLLCKGQSLVELLMAIGILSVILPALTFGILASRDGKAQQAQRLQAVALLKETEEAVRVVRENGWISFAVNGTYHPEISGNTWVLASGSATVNGFSRAVTISDVYRNTSGAIVATGGAVLDPSTKKVDISIGWTLPYPTTLDSTVYLTRYLENAVYTETTQTQFNAGTQTGVTVQATTGSGLADDGEIILGSGGHSNWCEPSLVENTLDLSGQGYASSITAIEGKIFAGTGENSSGLSFMAINVTDAYPPVPSQQNTFDGYKSNGVFGETNYGYITTDTNQREVVVINISGNPYSLSTFFDAPGNGSGDGIFVAGNTGYMTSGNKLYNFDLTNKNDPNNSRPLIDTDGVTLAGNGTDLYIVGNYAYLATDNASNELQIVDLSNPSNLTVIGQANTDSAAGVDVIVNPTGTRAYLATAGSATKHELFIINIEAKTGNRTIVGSYNTNYNGVVGDMSPKGVTVVPGNRVILVGQNGEEYQVINTQTESSPVHCGGIEVNTSVHSVASVIEESDGDAYSYIVTGDADEELKIIAGGPGGSYAAVGVFESATFDPGYQTANNRFQATFSQPSGTSLTFQVSMANAVGGVCPTTGYTYVGFDGLTTTQSSINSGESYTFPFNPVPPSYNNPGRCLRYKAYFTGNGTSTPVLNDVSINYSP